MQFAREKSILPSPLRDDSTGDRVCQGDRVCGDYPHVAVAGPANYVGPAALTPPRPRCQSPPSPNAPKPL